MLDRRTLTGAVVAGGALAAATFAFAATTAEPYSRQAFGAAQSAGKPILLHVTAPWCPTCRAQKPILSVIVMGFDRVVETALVNASPDWLTD